MTIKECPLIKVNVSIPTTLQYYTVCIAVYIIIIIIVYN